MTEDRTAAVAALFVQAQEAHHEFEATVLNGVYDEEWPRWYAEYAVENGLGGLVGHAIATDRLRAVPRRQLRGVRGRRTKAERSVACLHRQADHRRAVAARRDQSRLSFRQPPARLLAMIARNIARSAGSLIASPSR